MAGLLAPRIPKHASAGAGIHPLSPQRTASMFPTNVIVNYYQGITSSRVHGKLITKQVLRTYCIPGSQLSTEDTTVNDTGFKTHLLSDIVE